MITLRVEVSKFAMLLLAVADLLFQVSVVAALRVASPR